MSKVKSKERLLKLDKLREEKKDLEYFIWGNGRLGITVDVKLFKWFGCGQHEIYIKHNDTKELIFKILDNRLESVNIEIDNMFNE